VVARDTSAAADATLLSRSTPLALGRSFSPGARKLGGNIGWFGRETDSTVGADKLSG